jgi:hypothetical protein
LIPPSNPLRGKSTQVGRATEASRFPISFDWWYAKLSTILGLLPSASYVDAGREAIEVRMSWAFRCRFPRAAILSVSVLDWHPVSRGVHGWAGRWLVNGSGHGIVSIWLKPAQRARVLGFPVRLRELRVSVTDGAALAASLEEDQTRRR